MEYYIKSKEDYLYTLKRLEKKCSYIEISLMGNVLVNDIPVWRYNEVYNSLALNEIIAFYDKDNNFIIDTALEDKYILVGEKGIKY